MMLKKIIRNLTSFVTIFAVTFGIIVSYAPVGADELTVDDIKDRIEQINEMMAYNEAAYSTMGAIRNGGI